MSNLVQINPEYIYITIPAEYICVYHRIIAMLADYGEDMLKDCKASCTERNSGVIECYNMFNAAVAARKLGKTKLAETLIKYIKEKINMIYKGYDNSTSFVFPIDETGQLKAFVSCGELPEFYINLDDMNLYEHKYGNGFDEHFKLGPEDESNENDNEDEEENTEGLIISFEPQYHSNGEEDVPCIDLTITYNGISINPNNAIINYYFDDIEISSFNSVTNLETGNHEFKVVVTYNFETKIETKQLYYGTTEN